MTVYVPTVPADTGVVPVDGHTTIATAGGDNFVPINSRLVFFLTTTGAITFTIKGQAQVDGQTVPDRVVTISGAQDTVIGPIPAGPFAKSDGTCDFQVNTPGNVSKFYCIAVP